MAGMNVGLLLAAAILLAVSVARLALTRHFAGQSIVMALAACLVVLQEQSLIRSMVGIVSGRPYATFSARGIRGRRLMRWLRTPTIFSDLLRKEVRHFEPGLIS